MLADAEVRISFHRIPHTFLPQVVVSIPAVQDLDRVQHLLVCPIRAGFEPAFYFVSQFEMSLVFLFIEVVDALNLLRETFIEFMMLSSPKVLISNNRAQSLDL